jgi:hypothetical protein
MPQLVALVSRLVSQPLDPMPSQSAKGVMHCSLQLPPVHSAVSFGAGGGHGVSHEPQCSMSLCVSMQSMPPSSGQLVSVQVHCDDWHCVPWSQRTKHTPQLLSSVERSVQNAAPFAPPSAPPAHTD